MTYRSNTNFIKAIRFIYAHIDEPFHLEQLAQSIGLSLSSLKRLFHEMMNQTPGSFIRRCRMEYAFRSLQNKSDSILEIAMQSGFEDQSAFARAFKETFGFSPRLARKKINIVNELEAVTLTEPEIIELTALPIQAVTVEEAHYFEAAPKAWDALKKKLNADEIDDNFSGIFIGIGHDNPHEGDERVRFTAGVALLERQPDLDRQEISAGKYARFQYNGKVNMLGLAYHYIYGKWLKHHSYQINFAKPAFIIFDEFPQPLKEQSINIHVPIVD